MIRKLQYKFIAISAAAIVIVMASLLILVNQMFYRNAVSESFYALEYIAENDGELPDNYNRHMVRKFGNMTVELKYQLRYFSVWVDRDGSAISGMNLDHISRSAVSEKEAGTYAQTVISRGKERGIMKEKNAVYSYLVSDKEDKQLVVFMDCSKDMHSVEGLHRFSLWFSLVCLGFFLIVVSVLSRRAIRPVIRNMENQKQFITNASHELKTPLAIISANTEVLEMMEGENEWTRSTMSQVERLNGLIHDLIRLAKMGEVEKDEISEVDFSSAAEKTARDFKLLAEKNQLSLEYDITPGLKVRGVREHLVELVHILCDNAVKYCDEGGMIQVLYKKRSHHKGTLLTVSNTYAEGADIDYSLFFDRFYRADISHSSGKSGYGIGLSMAEGIVEESRGKIYVEYKGDRICFCVQFP